MKYKFCYLLSLAVFLLSAAQKLAIKPAFKIDPMSYRFHVIKVCHWLNLVSVCYRSIPIMKPCFEMEYYKIQTAARQQRLSSSHMSIHSTKWYKHFTITDTTLQTTPSRTGHQLRGGNRLTTVS